MSEFWVFGYGSLMWRPGFAYEHSTPARLWGYHRALCVYSFVHRGTPQQPGLVLGLDRGGSCRGVAFRIRQRDVEETLAYLRARELVTAVYIETKHPVRLLGAEERQVEAICYVVDQAHEQYAGKLDRAALLALVEQGRGGSGDNRDYVIATQNHMEDAGIHDPVLSWLKDELRARGYAPAAATSG